MKRLERYTLLADLFEYPDLEYPQRAGKVKSLLDEQGYAKAADELGRFLELLPAGELRTMQELFTRSFDVQAVTTLDIGYVLFGDDYKRGEMLANLNREHNEVQNDCRHELADHLPNVLRLLGKLENEELAEELVQEIVAPALGKMIGEFTPERIQERNKSYKKHYKTLIEAPAAQVEVATLYQWAVKSLYQVLKDDFSFEERVVPKSTSDFLQSVGRENEIEEKADACYSNTCL